jgi:putative transposase
MPAGDRQTCSAPACYRYRLLVVNVSCDVLPASPAIESLCSLLQKNVLDRRRWNTREEFRIAIVTWIERTYHRRRRQAAPGRLTPIEFDAIMATPASQAA